MQDSAVNSAQAPPALGGAPARPPKAGLIAHNGHLTEKAPTSQLICRVRPCERPSPLVTVSEAESRVEVAPEKGQPGEPFLFDHVLNQTGPGEQEALFALIKPAIIAGMNGQSSTIVAYGGPQSGKTYAVSGFFTHTRLHGVAPRGIQLIVDSMGKDPANSPGIEASFFELGQDAIYDLVPAGQPKLGMQESSQPPYALLDDRLAVVRCDGPAEYPRLLDTYFTGLEHVRKGAHICFQIGFVHEDRASGKPPARSYLRFVEMAWPRQQMSAAAPAGPPGVGSGANASKPAGLALAQGRAAAALDQVLHCKLTCSGSPPYRNSPLALLLKPCFEGGNLLHFIYCLRLEHSHLASLALAAPLLAKLHLWLTKASGTRDLSAAHNQALPSIVARAGLGKLSDNSRVVPPLQLQAAQGAPAEEPPQQSAPANDESTDRSSYCSSSGSSTGRNSAVAASSSAAISMPADADAGAGAYEVNSNHASQQAVNPSMEEICMMRDCAMLLEVKQRSLEMLRADAERSASVLHKLETVLCQLRGKREAGGDNGPNEKETNLRLLKEKVSRSLSRGTEELQRMNEDIETIAQFCEGGRLPPVYDSYNVTESNVQALIKHAALQQEVAKPAVSIASAPGGALPSRPRAPVPALPLSMLPQEIVEMPQQAPAQPGSREQLSPSSASSCSSPEALPHAPGQGITLGGTPLVGTPLAGTPLAGTPLAPAVVDVGRSPATVMRCTNNFGPHVMSLPHTPPMPAAPARAVSCQPALAAHGGQYFVNGGNSGMTQSSLDNSRMADDSDLSQHNIEPAATGLTAARHVVLPPHELQRSSSSLQLPGQPAVHVQLPPDAGTGDGALDSRLRKSNSTTSMRSLGSAAVSAIALSSGAMAGGNLRAPPGGVTTVSAAASPVPPAFASPPLGHRATLSNQSPLRSAVTSGSGGSLLASAATGNTLAQSQSMSALPGNISPLLQPKRGVVPAAARAPPRQAPSISPGSSLCSNAYAAPGDGTVARQSTPVPQASKGPEVRTRGSTGSGAQAHSPSPVMMRRSVSTQALRVERGAQPARQPQPMEKSLPRSNPGGISPMPQRPGGPFGVPPAVSPARAITT